LTIVRTFTSADQEDFARWSGDWNPIHMDPLAARRSVAGAPVVHGVHLLLWALDEVLRDTAVLLPVGIRADFRKFVLVGQPVSLEPGGERDDQPSWRLSTADGVVATVRFRPSKFSSDDAGSANLPSVDGGLHEPGWDEMRLASGRLALIQEYGVCHAFPNISARLFDRQLAGLARISALVGMVCPGLRSILASIYVDLGRDAEGPAEIGFHTTKADDRYRLVRMEVSGPGVRGVVDAFVRPEPFEPLTMAEAAELVRPNEFAGRRALIVGGSRGLGAVTAKLLAAGGADVTITYASGSSEAAAICRAVAAQGHGTCNAMVLDVLKQITDQLANVPWRPTHIYYFATPRIFLQKKPEFDRETFDRFADYYVDSFNAICTHFALAGTEPVAVLYPSSLAVTDRPPGLTEYAMAKAAGELLCTDLMRLHPNLHIAVERLPRILTDQTATVQQVPSARAEDIMLPLLTREALPKQS
jgi:hypothetical protein